MNVPRVALVAFTATLAVACSGASPTPGGGSRGGAGGTAGTGDSTGNGATATADAAPPPTAAELALAAHGERLRDGRGVVAVEVAPSGDGLQVTLCALEAAATLDTRGVDVPVATVVSAEPGATARGEPCGCVHDGAYYASGESYQVDCNTCTCNAGGGRCTLLGCDLLILEQIYFAGGSAKVGKASQPVIDAIAATLKDHPSIRLRVIGHAGQAEKQARKVAKQRAAAVRAALIAAGVDAARLELLAVGAERPTGQGVKADRRVSFEVIEGAAD